MKKILTLAFLVIGATTFSAGCDWFKGNTKYADKMVELVKKEGLTSKDYCDMDQKKMVYETLYNKTNEKYIEIGLSYNKNKKNDLTYADILNSFAEFEKDIDKLYPWTNLTKPEYQNAPRYYNYRMYIYSPESQNEYMAFLVTYDTSNGTWKKYYNNGFWKGKDEVEKEIIDLMKKKGLKETDNIIY